MGLRSLYICISFIAGIDFRRQILTSKGDPRTEIGEIVCRGCPGKQLLLKNVHFS